MGHHLAPLLALLMLAGCSKLYDPDRLARAADAPTELVSNNLMLSGVSPAEIAEGQGDGGSRPAIVVISGSNIAHDAAIEIKPVMGDQRPFSIGELTFATDFSSLAVSLTIPAAKMLASDMRLDITVSQPAGDGTMVSQSLMASLTIKALPELDSDTASMVVDMNNVGDSTKLAPLYSKIDLSSKQLISWMGAKRVELRATSSIKVMGMEANGLDGNGTTPAAARLGGCRGGGPAQQGGCDGGGGGGKSGALLSPGGGGGAGFSETGASGGGNEAGSPGIITGSPAIATYETFGSFSANKASGGGGGGNLGVGTGAGGGGGGGTIELTAGGHITAGVLTASGGRGGNSGAHGGGGGGAGGVIMLRSGGTLAVGMVAVPGGPGGDGAGMADGGAGSPGRVRWDAPPDARPPPAMVVTPHRGPAYAPDTPLVFNEREPAITLYGTVNDSFDIHVTDQEGTQRPSGDGTFTGSSVTIKPTLQKGYNLVCITLQGGPKGAPEADKCIEVAFVP